MGMSQAHKASKLKNLIQIARSGYDLYKEDFDILYDLYKGIFPPEVWNDLAQRRKSALYVNKVYALTNRLRAGTEKAYFSGRDIASFWTDRQNVEEATEKLQGAFSFYWNKRMNSYFNMSKCFTEGYVYGTPVAKVYWGDNRPIVEPLSLHTIYFDPSALSFNDNKFMVNLIFRTVDEIEADTKAGIYNSKFNLKNIKPNNEVVETNSGLVDTQDEESYGRVTLKDVYEKINGKWHLSTTYNETEVLRWRQVLNDGLPIIAGATVPELMSSTKESVPTYSASLLAPIVDLQKELLVRINQEIDAIAENVNPSYEAEVTSGLKEVDIRKGASKVIYCQNLDQIRRVTPPPLAPLQVNEERIRQDMEDISGISQFSADNSAMINRQTATGMDILSSEKDVRMDNYIRAVNETFVEPIISRIGMLIWKYAPQERFFKGVDRSFDYDFNVNVSAGLGSTSRQVQLNGYQELFTKFMELGDTERARQSVYDSMALMGIKNTGEYYEEKTKTELDAEREEQLAQQQAMQEEAMQIEKQKIALEMEKTKSEIALNGLLAKKATLEIELAKEKQEDDLDVEMQKLATDNRKIDVQESQMLLDIANQEKGDSDGSNNE